MRIPAAPWPSGTRFISFLAATSKITKSVPPRLETKANFPSGVNFRRFAPRILASRVCTTFLAARSMMEMEPSCALATQISFLSGETSKPSDPFPTGITVSVQFILGPRGGPAGPPDLGPDPGAPGGGGGGPEEAFDFSMRVMVAELTLVVTMGGRGGK